MRNCIVPRCDYKNKQNPKRAMFNVPIKDPDLLRKWQNALPVKRPLKEFERVCEQHFHEGDILRYWEHTINGNVERMERHKPALKPNSVPVFVDVNVDDETSLKRKIKKVDLSEKRKKPRRNTEERQTHEYHQTGERQTDEHQTEEYQTEERLTEERLTEERLIQCQQTEVHGMVEVINVEQSADSTVQIMQVENAPPESQTIEEKESDSVTYEISQLEHSDFETLYDEVYEVVLPSTLWGIHRDVEKTFICFTEFSTVNMNARKYLFIDRYLQYQMAVGQRIMKRGVLSEGSTEKVTQLLNKLDGVKIRQVIIKGSKSILGS